MLPDILDKKVAVIGLGLDGISLVEYLYQKGVKDITVCDQKDVQELGEKYSQISQLPVQWRLGVNYLKDLSDFDIVFRSPGVKRSLPEISKVEKAGIMISSQTKLFFQLCPCPIIGVTGTKGKGTTTTLIAEMLKGTSNRQVFIGSNIGVPPLTFLDKLSINDFVVLELSSFHLQDLNQSPYIAVVLNITCDHLDYHATREEYVKAKRTIVSYQTFNDFVVVNADCETSFGFAEESQAQQYYFSRKREVSRGAYIEEKNRIMLKLNNSSGQEICKTKDILLRGEHNWENITAALTASYLASADIGQIQKAIKTFKGLEHRLELVREVDGVEYYNDSFSTTPESCIAAIKSFYEPVILIAGGSEKGADYNELGEKISNSSIKDLILIGAMARRIKFAVEKTNKFQGRIVEGCKNMKEIFQAITHEAKFGDVVLLSPACASFGMFQDYQDRGRQFKEIVNNL